MSLDFIADRLVLNLSHKLSDVVHSTGGNQQLALSDKRQ